MTLPANIRVNVRAPFPTQVRGAAFVGVQKANGVWTIKPDYRLVAPASGVTGRQIIAVQDVTTGLWSYLNVLSLTAATIVYRIVTAPGAVTILSSDVTILLQKTTSGASTINLPNSATRGGLPVTVKDLTGDANTNNITFAPALGETIDGLSAAAAAANGLAVIDTDYGSKTLYPLQAGGWYTI